MANEPIPDKRLSELDTLTEVGSMSWERRAGDALDALPELLAEVWRLKRMTQAMAAEIADKRYDPQSQITPRDTQASVLKEYIKYAEYGKEKS